MLYFFYKNPSIFLKEINGFPVPSGEHGEERTKSPCPAAHKTNREKARTTKTDMKELLVYIAYKACRGYESRSNSSSWVFTRAKSLIASIIFFHLVHLVILLADKKYFPLRTIEAGFFFGFLAAYISIIIICEFVFTRKILARAIAVYKDHWVNSYVKLFAFGYLVFALVLTAVLVYIRSA